MSEPQRPRRRPRRRTVGEQVGAREQRKLRARRGRDRSVWFGLGTFGMIGWSVAIPALLGLALGVWLDARFTGSPSWTLTLLLGGLMLGCINAWYWLANEQRLIEAEDADPPETAAPSETEDKHDSS